MHARPNVVIVLADDLGFSDIAPYGGEIDTPHLTRLAGRGVRMESYYVTPRCSPSRAALMTGHHPHSVGIGVLTTNNGPKGYPGSLTTEVPTIAERLKEHGYRTGLFGKWHLSSELNTPCETWPTRRGFDEFRGMLQGSSGFFNPPLMAGEARVTNEEMPEDFYLTDDISEHAAEFIKRQAGTSTPFLAMLTYTAPHWPLHAREGEIAKYRERFRGGWTGMPEKRLAGLHQKGLLTEIDSVHHEQDLPEWGEDAAWEVERMAVYAAQVECMDQGIGHVLDTLEEAGIEDDTIVMFFSDNGGCAEELPVHSPSFPKATEPRTTRDGRPVHFGNDPAVMPGPADTFQSYGETWATVSNTPFRKWKRWVHEGGISSPFIVSWPAGGIPTGGEVSCAVGHVIDIVPTVMGILGVEGVGEGENLIDAWRSPVTEGGPERTICWEHIGNSALRRGRWKLVREWGSPWELYDLVADRTESRNLVAEHPELTEDLKREYQAWCQEHGVIDWQDMLDDHIARGSSPEHATG
ncbi:sulfatase-like hydrolase/transferase [Occultella kanbiaonis]|uniref:sulfatase-like hydrolase/transferase n=1 Tax=Occultella kanbiaonis TaxID=2675754 RepID=UPI0013D5FFC9|nr:sulfatase-like hydrolase/transferase [Occultella kanbiaonis]